MGVFQRYIHIKMALLINTLIYEEYICKTGSCSNKEAGTGHTLKLHQSTN